MKKVVILGAGPGGLAAGLILQNQGFDVTIIEKEANVGGRSRKIKLGDFSFDSGPTFLMHLKPLREIFALGGFDLDTSLELIRLDPLYRLVFDTQTLVIHQEKEKNIAMFNSIEQGLGTSYTKWYDNQEKKLSAITPILENPFPSWTHFFRKDVLQAIPYVHPFKTVYQMLKRYNKNPYFIHALSFQAKYLGMASYQAPSIFTILPYLEHHGGLYHVKGGLNQIAETMAKLFIEKKGTLHLNTKINHVHVNQKVITSLEDDKGNHYEADAFILNSDFAYTMTQLFKSSDLKKYTPKVIAKKDYSVSTWMLYIGLNTTLDLPHHEIIFSKDYDQYLKDLMQGKLSEDISVYIHNPSVIDDTYAPKGKSALYILVPVPNETANIAWDQKSPLIKDKVISLIKDKHGIDITHFIETSLIYTPYDWMTKDHVYQGAVFNLSHKLSQMLHRRPHNKFEEFHNAYLVGGGTHPGSGLPTIYQSALISAKLLMKDMGHNL